MRSLNIPFLSALIIFSLILPSKILALADPEATTQYTSSASPANPLLQDDLTLPRFDLIKPEHFRPAIEEGIKNNQITIDKLVTQEKYTWDNFIVPLDEASEKLNQIWTTIHHINMVMGTAAVQKAHEECIPLITSYRTQVAQDKRIYDAIKQVSESREYKNLDLIQKKIIADKLRNFHLAGVALPAAKKERFIQLKQKLAELSNQFANNLLQAVQTYSLKITEEETSGLPESSIQLGRKNANKKNENGLIFSLDLPSLDAFASYSDLRDLRKKISIDYLTRASDKGHNKNYDNTIIIEEMLKTRKELATLLSFNNFAEYSLANNKMAASTKEVTDFLYDLANKSRAKALAELQKLKEIAARDGIKQIEPWDIGTSWRYQGYYVAKLQKEKFDISQEELRVYFPGSHVLKGVFEIIERLYGVTFKENKKVPVWHDDVKFFELYDRDKNLIGHIYLDLYTRDGKQVGAWMNERAPNRYVDKDGNLKLPMTYLVCNFAPPTDGKPSLFTHKQVITLLHEFGHSLQHLLTKIDYLSAAGMHKLAPDTSEIASQFMENWGWQKEGLKLLAKHYQTGEPLPKPMLERLLKTRTFQTAMNKLYQTEFSLIDFKIHLEQATSTAEIEKIIAATRKDIRIAPVYQDDRAVHYFHHIFADPEEPYEAGYYSYLWAEVMAADLFSKFEEQGIFNPTTAQEFLHKFLERGSSKNIADLIKDFLGRNYQIDTFLRHLGILENGSNLETISTRDSSPYIKDEL